MMRGLLIALAAVVAAHPFGLDFEEDVVDRAYGHHGKPAEYKSLEGIVHPWREAGGRQNVVVSDPLAALHALWLEDMDRLDYELADTVGVMDPFGELHVRMEAKKEPRPAASDSDEEDMAMLTIMESTPDMCPLCAKEGHALGHDAHKKLLARLREKLVREEKDKKEKKNKAMAAKDDDMATMLGCELCMAEGNTHNHKEHLAVKECGCALCKAEGTQEHHATHQALLTLAKELSFAPKPKRPESGCRLCCAEGTTRNHSKHAELARMAEHKPRLDAGCSGELRRMLALLDEHRDVAIAAKAEAQWAKDRRQRTAVPEISFEFAFDDMHMDMDMDMMDDDLFSHMPYDMMKMTRPEPPRDFHRRLGEPADDMDMDDEDEEEEESLWDRIIRNIRDILGMDEDAMYARLDSEDGAGEMKDLGGIIAMLLLLFVGLLLVSFGLVELLSVLLGEDGSAGKYQALSYDEEERMILDLEGGAAAAAAAMAMDMRREPAKGAIAI